MHESEGLLWLFSLQMSIFGGSIAGEECHEAKAEVSTNLALINNRKYSTKSYFRMFIVSGHFKHNTSNFL